MTAERLCSSVLAVVVVEFGLGLERLLAHVAHELAFAEKNYRKFIFNIILYRYY